MGLPSPPLSGLRAAWERAMLKLRSSPGALSGLASASGPCTLTRGVGLGLTAAGQPCIWGWRSEALLSVAQIG